MLHRDIKSSLRGVVSSVYYATGHFLSLFKGRVLILMYHRVLPSAEVVQSYVQAGMYVQNDIFERQLRFLKRHFRILRFSELLDIWEGKGLDRDTRYCVLTFDDGWRDNYLYAYPALKEHRVPATLFLPTSLVGSGYWLWSDRMGYLLKALFDTEGEREGRRLLRSLLAESGRGKLTAPDSAGETIDSVIEQCKALPEGEIESLIGTLRAKTGAEIPGKRRFLTWKEAREMSEGGISFGAHSCTHRILTALSRDEVEQEAADSFEVLRREGVDSVPVFCYPDGQSTPAIERQIQAAGYRAAVSTTFGFEGAIPQNRFRLRRIGIHNDISRTAPLLVGRMAGIHRVFTR
ncbi:MAG: polysaccharide deacetylase family protein [Alphaproteobacteria bacterium]|uniref:Polysaccharide deacetylase family protein n=1 Tax=Candidatus Nitrobium versatile TaxID=2884831 RepID=A0A953JC48_9BACT|nr:polysaccharide deacetylase family protein [Candidatus Nitrobium versatile]